MKVPQSREYTGEDTCAQLTGRCKELNCPIRGGKGFGERLPMTPKDISLSSQHQEEVQQATFWISTGYRGTDKGT